MKLRNLLFGTMIACAFASCSSENDPIVDVTTGVEQEGEATLSVRINSVETKAATDTDIENLSVLVFYGEGDGAHLEIIGDGSDVDGKKGSFEDTNDQQLTSVMKIPVMSGTKQVLVLANVDLSDYNLVQDRANGTTLSTVKGLKKQFGEDKDEVNGTLSMNSKIYSVTLTASTENCLGFTADEDNGQTQVIGTGVTDPVKLYRNVAKISLNSVTNTAAAGYKNGQLTVTNVFILHGKSMTSLVGANGNEWGATEVAADAVGLQYLNGMPAFTENATLDSYADWVEYMGDKTAIYNYLRSNNYAERDDYVSTSTTYGDNLSFYTYENTNRGEGAINTLLVVKGNYSYEDVNGDTHTEYDRYYPVAVGVTGVTSTALPKSFTDLQHGREIASAPGVLRNLWYKVSMTVTGPGYATPFGPKADGGTTPDPDDPSKPIPGDGDTFLSVTCEVVDFGEVTQNGGSIE